MLKKVKSFRRGEHRYTLYAGGSWAVFEDHSDHAEEIGTITSVEDRYAAAPRFHQHLSVSCPTLDQAVETLVTIHETGGKP